MTADPTAVARSELPELLAVVERWAGILPPDAPAPARIAGRPDDRVPPDAEPLDRTPSVLHWRGRLPGPRRPDDPSPAALSSRPSPRPALVPDTSEAADAQATGPSSPGTDAPAHRTAAPPGQRPPGPPALPETEDRAPAEHPGDAAPALSGASPAAADVPPAIHAPTARPAATAGRPARPTTPAPAIAPQPPRAAVHTADAPTREPRSDPLAGLLAPRRRTAFEPAVPEPWADGEQRADRLRGRMPAPEAVHAGAGRPLTESAEDLEERLADVLEAAVLEAGIDLS